uniref:Uncharacterized protein n=1 Tax=Pyxicephalus adspersus TaxID=30357 RepID=A0AAV3AMN3_PYXAD|nr:TPA: hypothetical protein GDO54_008316 [Pyxicephalus adspersus]
MSTSEWCLYKMNIYSVWSATPCRADPVAQQRVYLKSKSPMQKSYSKNIPVSVKKNKNKKTKPFLILCRFIFQSSAQ